MVEGLKSPRWDQHIFNVLFLQKFRVLGDTKKFTFLSRKQGQGSGCKINTLDFLLIMKMLSLFSNLLWLPNSISIKTLKLFIMNKVQ